MDANYANGISAVGSLLSGLATLASIFVAYKVHQNQKLLTQRQLILPLWEHMASLSNVNPANPITSDLVKVVNTLELVALCCEGGMIDERIIRRTFKDQFMSHYDSVNKCISVPGTTLSGQDFLMQNRAAVQFYNSLNQERLAQDRVTPV